MKYRTFDGKDLGNTIIDYSTFDRYFNAFYNRGKKMELIGCGFSFDFLSISPRFSEESGWSVFSIGYNSDAV
ncbi:MAG: hypothetical protein OXC03_07570 [Flavobacteriaceae bacterium]|nr:hypothetical protein [Flavobacteriaceae bacterium]